MLAQSVFLTKASRFHGDSMFRLPSMVVAIKLPTSVLSICLFLAGCGGANGSGGAVSVIEKEGEAICVFAGDGREIGVGTLAGEEVTLYASYGGGTISMDVLKETMSGIEPADVEGLDYRAQRMLLKDVIAARRAVDEIPRAEE
jgi:hypothetical protein